jgi:hypothetical protein
MLKTNWGALLFLSFVLAAVINALLSCCFSFYYKKYSSGQLSHSQLRVKQGSAKFDHRLNVFARSLVFSPGNLKVLTGTGILWLAINMVPGYL